MERSKTSNKQPAFALIGRTENLQNVRQIPVCPHCKRRGHLEPTCWETYPHLKPGHKSLVTEALHCNDRVDSSSDEKILFVVSLEKIAVILNGSFIPVQGLTCAIRKSCFLS